LDQSIFTITLTGEIRSNISPYSYSSTMEETAHITTFAYVFINHNLWQIFENGLVHDIW